jgi:hypothetical protein
VCIECMAVLGQLWLWARSLQRSGRLVGERGCRCHHGLGVRGSAVLHRPIIPGLLPAAQYVMLPWAMAFDIYWCCTFAMNLFNICYILFASAVSRDLANLRQHPLLIRIICGWFVCLHSAGHHLTVCVRVPSPGRPLNDALWTKFRQLLDTCHEISLCVGGASGFF